jgi:hypothetical protein
MTAIAQCPFDGGSSASFPDPPSIGSFVYIPLDDISAIRDEVEGETYEIDPFVSAVGAKIMRPNLVFGTISCIQTASIDPSRRPTAIGISNADELRRAQPQIFELLTTEFTIALTSFTSPKGNVVHRLPPKPPHIHSFVYQPDDSQLIALTEDFGFLRTLLASSSGMQIPADELTAAAILSAWEVRRFDENYIVLAGRALLRLLSNDYHRFQSIMQRLG